MKIIRSDAELRHYVKECQHQNLSIGFVPTMGALHKGHLELVKRCRQENDVVVSSIFVNPLQFNDIKDFEKYPVDQDKDFELLKSVACDVTFAPNTKDFYIEKPIVEVEFGEMTRILEGALRPGHFNGVVVVLSRLFHLLQPTRAYFGLKDLQQYCVVKRMVQDFGFNLEIVPCDIIREEDGLAMSSRNRRLNENDRQLAPLIYELLKFSRDIIIREQSFNGDDILASFQNTAIKAFTIEYLELVKLPNFSIQREVYKGQEYAICFAAFIGGIRLIDNVRFVA